jgi:TPR repeat protein
MRFTRVVLALFAALTLAASGCSRASHLEKACYEGGAIACLELGKMYYTGEAVRRDTDRAALLLQQACRGSVAEGCYRLGLMYESGTGIGLDTSRASALFEEACDGGYAQACH